VYTCILDVNHRVLKDELFMTSDFVSYILFSLYNVLKKPQTEYGVELKEIGIISVMPYSPIIQFGTF
jgi:hypothetical protein